MALEFAVDDAGGHERIFKTFDEAAGFAVAVACTHGKPVHVDVLAYSVADARQWAGPDGGDSYNEDPEASVFDRVVVRAESIGRVA